jgi:hypothetical protein
MLVVLIDADGDVDRRLRQFRDALTQAGLTPRAFGERISHFIPNRNIETWILCLNGQTVDEVTDYKHERGIDEQIGPAAESFFAWSRPNSAPPAHCVPSLHAALPEARRIG